MAASRPVSRWFDPTSGTPPPGTACRLTDGTYRRSSSATSVSSSTSGAAAMMPSTRRSISVRTMSAPSAPPAARWPTRTECPFLRAACSAATEAWAMATSVASLATRPMVAVARWTRLRAIVFGRYPSSAAAARIRSSVSTDTRTSPPLRTLLAVWKLTPARAATSLIDT